MIARLETPFGCLWTAGSADAVEKVSWTPLDGPHHKGELDWILDPLRAYFDGALEALPGRILFLGPGVLWVKNHVNTRPHTRAQEILDLIFAIPYGKRATYGEIAASVGYKKGARAIGAVCKSNPLPVLIPCHRVVGARSLGGYTPDVTIKEGLLGLESKVLASRRPTGSTGSLPSNIPLAQGGGNGWVDSPDGVS